MRNVAPIALDGVTPRDLSGEADPSVEHVDPRELWIDEQYQRNPSARTLALVRRIVAGWSWSKFKPPVVVRVDGRLHVLDGQHTAIAAASHGGIRAVPVIVVAAPDVSDRAAAFVSHATDRVQASALQVHRAAVVAGDGAAVAVADLCREAGVALLPFAPGHGSSYGPRETVALASIRGLVGRRGAERAREVLAALAAADLAPIPADHIRAADALLHDDAYAGDFDAGRVTAAFRALTPALLAEARALAAAKDLPAWRALAATLCRRAPKPRGPKYKPYMPTMPALLPGERLSTPTKPPRGARTFAALTAIVMPSDDLAALVGAGPLLRVDAVEAVNKYIRTHDLLDAVDRRVVVADAKLRGVFGRERFNVAELEGMFAEHLGVVPERGDDSARREAAGVGP